jgi:N4-bis(aminopropyl)spermidine synthase
MQNLIYDLKTKNPDLKEAEIAGLLHMILHSTTSKKTLANSEFIRLTGVPKETLRKFKGSISQLLQEPTADEIVLNEQGNKILKDLDLLPYKWRMVEYTDEAAQQTAQKLKALREQYDLTPKREFDQFFATEETSGAKARALMDKGLVKGKNICILGDDDLVSITLFLIDNSFNEILVLDIDETILQAIGKIAQDLGITNIRTELYDARKTPRSELLNKFDVVLTDPPYTKSGVSLFVHRAINFLQVAKDDSGPYIFLFVGHSLKEPEKTLKVQDVVQKYNLVIEDKIDKFSRYNGAESIGSASSLYILKTNRHTVAREDYLKTTIYTFEDTYEEKFPFVDHYVFKLFKVPGAVVSSKKGLLKACGQFCLWHKLKVVDSNVTKFKGGGMTLTFILANSNLVVHTWPEHGALHIDLITCSPIVKKDRFGENLAELFKTKFIEISKIE